ncbi:M28 family peptidase [Sphaerobacter thermophilus]|uniref:Peptidase M28 domain-containing protein n=1 Tax=Sphaerobacter thermophilus (strain ATCC 49802 / DSM 20745 / KCCM 41009 / NCIMB 13125 / S 6022) TaxID=479434 RepID=D1C818_SPHTD|nr:M28 family peptidase [Sphaerobacter thermophilus]ACZ39961.1 hypothetical protein Sthe_2546 [Sphaerobacter thermophilus DSM 20745]
MAVDPNDIATLATRIGPRPPGSPYERRAAGYVIERLQQMGVASTLLPVRIPRGFNLVYATLFVVAALSVPLALVSEILALVISLAALVLAALEVTGRPALSRLAATRISHNVLGLIAPARGLPAGEREQPRRVVITAHLDTARSGWLSQQPIVARLRLLAVATAASMILLPVLQAVALATPSRIPWYASLVPLVILIGATVLLLQRELRGVPVAGANDDASGVAALLSIAGALRRNPPRELEVWLLFTAGAEAGGAGIRQFLRDNLFDPDRTSFISLDSVGAGNIRFTRGEGLLLLRRSSPMLLRIAGEVAREHPEWGLRPQTHRLPATDQSVVLLHGYTAIGLFAADDQGFIPNWHQTSDTPERVDIRTVARAVDVALAMIRHLDTSANHESVAPSLGSEPGTTSRP